MAMGSAWVESPRLDMVVLWIEFVKLTVRSMTLYGWPSKTDVETGQGWARAIHSCSTTLSPSSSCHYKEIPGMSMPCGCEKDCMRSYDAIGAAPDRFP